jgi:tRNA dimethylallyltransferase
MNPVSERRPDAVLIAGPTASGKSALALALADRLRGIVINVDSMQVYRDLRVLTARPTPEEEARTSHRLYGYVDAGENHSAGRWFADAQRILSEARGAGLLPILVGGTGLYFKVLTAGLAAIPPIDPAIRARLRNDLAARGVEALHAQLQQSDPESAARIMLRDQSRILRALEVMEATGRTMSDWHREELPPAIAPGRAIRMFLTPEREELKRRIETRFAQMLQAGALDEVRALEARGLPDYLPAMKAHGVPWLRRHLRGEISLDEAAAGGTMDTRRYAKRQVTWFRNQMPDWTWVAPEQGVAAVLKAIAAESSAPIGCSGFSAIRRSGGRQPRDRSRSATG